MKGRPADSAPTSGLPLVQGKRAPPRSRVAAVTRNQASDYDPSPTPSLVEIADRPVAVTDDESPGARRGCSSGALFKPTSHLVINLAPPTRVPRNRGRLQSAQLITRLTELKLQPRLLSSASVALRRRGGTLLSRATRAIAIKRCFRERPRNLRGP